MTLSVTTQKSILSSLPPALVLGLLSGLLSCGQQAFNPAPPLEFTRRLYQNNPTQITPNDLALVVAFIQSQGSATQEQLAALAGELLGQPGSVGLPLDPPVTTANLDYGLPAGSIDENDLAIVLAVQQLGSGASVGAIAQRASLLLGLDPNRITPSDIRQIPTLGFPGTPSPAPVTAQIDVPLNRLVGQGTIFPKAKDIEVELTYPNDVEKANRILVGGLNFDRVPSSGSPTRYQPTVGEEDLPKGTVLRVGIQSQQARALPSIQITIRAVGDGSLLGQADSKPLPTVVNTLEDENGTDLAQCSLREAIIANNTSDSFGGCLDPQGSITFGPTVTGTLTLTGSGLPTLTEPVALVGPGAETLTISGNQQFRVFDVGSGTTVSIEGLTIANGQAPTEQDGGGIRSAGTLTVSHSTLTGNSAKYGGAIAAEFGATITVSNSTLNDNRAGLGGGILGNGGSVVVTTSALTQNSANSGGAILSLGGTIAVTNSTLSGNSATVGGGGIFQNQRGVLTVSSSLLSGNTANQEGGGILQSEGQMQVTHSTLSGNSAPYGGGIRGYANAVTVSNTTVSGNSAGNSGGGIEIASGSLPEQQGSLSLSNSTLSGNVALAGGGGIRLSEATAVLTQSTLTGNSAGSPGGGGILVFGSYSGATLRNTLISGNLTSSIGPNCRSQLGQFYTNASNLFGTNASSGGCPPVTTDLVPSAGVFIGDILSPLADNGGFLTGAPSSSQGIQTHALPPGSPALNAGNNATVPAGVTTDQRGSGFNRIQNGTVDIGAFEVQ